MKLLPKGLTRTVAKTVLKAKANSPHIFFIGGVVGVVGAGVLACRATLDLDKELDEIRHNLADVRELHEAKASQDPQNYDENEHYKNLCVVYLKSAVEVGKLYGPAIIVGTISVAALAGSHIQLTRRNAALTATLAAVTKAFDDYRTRVREEIGEERELDIHRGVSNELVEINGKKQVVKVVNPNNMSHYARCFDEVNRNWTKHPETNACFLSVQQKHLNDRLVARGHVFLNEVYDMLGFEPTKEGQIVGWVYEYDGNPAGDNMIDFGLYEAYNMRFIEGHERSIWLDFNVDGPVLNRVFGDD